MKNTRVVSQTPDKAALIGGVTAGAFGMAHGMSDAGFGNQLLKITAHGTIGGVSSVLQGKE